MNGERKHKDKRPKSKPEAQKTKMGSQIGKRINYVPKPPPITRNMWKWKKT